MGTREIIQVVIAVAILALLLASAHNRRGLAAENMDLVLEVEELRERIDWCRYKQGAELINVR